MREIDFLRGRPATNLACFALPALGANLLQSADQVMDMLVVGAFVLMFTKNWSEWSPLFEHRGH